MNCESSDAILQTYIIPVNSTSDAFSEASEEEEEIMSEPESETEMPVDEYLYQSQMYDENGDMIGDEDNLENTLDVSCVPSIRNQLTVISTFQDELSKSASIDLVEKPPKPKRESTKARAARLKRNQIEKNQDQQKIHICEICGNSYKYRHALEVHMRR